MQICACNPKFAGYGKGMVINMVLKSQEIKVAADIKNSDIVVEFIFEILKEMECSKVTKNQLAAAVEELYGNITRYAYESTLGYVIIRCTPDFRNNQVVIQFLDGGKPFNPLDYKEPDIKSDVRERQIGGLGIFIAKKFVDQFLYQYTEGKNVVTIMKKLA